MAGSAPGEADARSSSTASTCGRRLLRALEADDPLRADPPMHPSYEDREGAPDRVFAKVDDETYEHLVDAWEGHLREAGAATRTSST